ncbi:hypothetical protein ES695_04085 [Candidatus Atribacteria bacterium 1244-E10-H5-B2]|nr:MAG: hypothetical protein ES695_04085 [Candidatus Atribacteria bacterium 1244-E10-H5-B2]
MAGTWGYALKGFASGLSSGFAMGLEKSKIDALKKEQKRLEEAQKEAKRVFQVWYDSPSTKEFCANLDTANQGERAYFISGLLKMNKDIFNYFTEIDNDIREGNIKAAQSKNDLLETKIKAATDLATLGMTATFPDGSPMTIPPEDIEFQKQIQIGKMAGGPTGEAMGMQMWKRRGLEEITPTPEAPAIKDYSDAWNYLYKYKDVPPETFNKVKPGFQKQFPEIDMSDITQEALRSGVKPEAEPVKRTDIEYWRKREDTVKSEEDWDRYLFDLKQSESTYETEDATWKDRLLRDVKDLEAGIKDQLLDEGGKIRLLDKDGTPKEINLGGKKMTVEEAYTTLQKLYEEKVRELMEKYPDVDIKTLIKFLSLEEIGTVKAWDVASRIKGYLPSEARDISLISTY